MKTLRQSERRARFQEALAMMPLWETWTTEDGKPSATLDAETRKIVQFGATRHHCKGISRRTRRSMARDLSRREYRSMRGLPEPKGA